MPEIAIHELAEYKNDGLQPKITPLFLTNCNMLLFVEHSKWFGLLGKDLEKNEIHYFDLIKKYRAYLNVLASADEFIKQSGAVYSFYKACDRDKDQLVILRRNLDYYLSGIKKIRETAEALIEDFVAKAPQYDYSYPPSYTVLIDKEEGAIAKAIAIFEDYSRNQILRLHWRHHSGSSDAILKRLRVSEDSPEGIDNVIAYLESLRNNLILEGTLKSSSSFSTRLSFVLHRVLAEYNPQVRQEAYYAYNR